MTDLVHLLSRGEILRHALDMRREGGLYNLNHPEMDGVFAGSIDRFTEIAFRLRACRKVLDVGSGHGMLLSLLNDLGHECYGVDFTDQTGAYPDVYRNKPVRFQVCNVEVDPLPFDDDSFDAVTCCQVLEHFTHSHLPLVQEIRRVLRTNGLVEVDVPNVASFRNRSRMLRGKNITYDYLEHYLHAKPVCHKGHSFYPVRHNREFTRDELKMLLEHGGFRHIEVAFLKSRHYREGVERLKSFGSAMRDVIPSLRKSLIAFAEK